MQGNERVVFLDYLRVIACFMVMAIHACEPFYLGGEQGAFIATRADALWVTVTEVLCRVCVPLFAIASGYLLFPLTRPTGEFFRRRLGRIVVPFLFWSAAYVWQAGGSWGQALLNFPAAAGHLWFVPMLLGVYLLMPLLSPWAEKASEKEVRGWIGLWLATTTFPYLRGIWTALWGEPLYGFGVVPTLYGECPWNPFGTFHYVSGFIGYLLLGLWFRRFAPALPRAKAVTAGALFWAAGAVIMGGGFYFRLPASFPCSTTYAAAVSWETSLEYCSLGVALGTIGAFWLLRAVPATGGRFYARVIRPLAQASYGTYLLHMFILTPVFAALRPLLPTPLAILLTAAACFVLSSAASLAIGRLPRIGRWICG
jgi:surface polysaccharide O-acyltransferase-like enzyme